MQYTCAGMMPEHCLRSLTAPVSALLCQVQGVAARALYRGSYPVAVLTGLSRMSDVPRAARSKIWRRSLQRPAPYNSCAPLSTLRSLPNLPEDLSELYTQHRSERRAVRRPSAEVRAEAAAAYSRLKAAIPNVSPQRRRQILEMRAVHGLPAMNKFVAHLLAHDDESACDTTSEEETATEVQTSNGAHLGEQANLRRVCHVASATDSSFLDLTVGSGSQSSGRAFAPGDGTSRSTSPRRFENVASGGSGFVPAEPES
jgi:hypothetical protein